MRDVHRRPTADDVRSGDSQACFPLFRYLFRTTDVTGHRWLRWQTVLCEMVMARDFLEDSEILKFSRSGLRPLASRAATPRQGWGPAGPEGGGERYRLGKAKSHSDNSMT
jgi:hypothetical protein